MGFVVMPDHVHAVIRFEEKNQLSRFMQQWKRISSFQIKKFIKQNIGNYASKIDISDPVWQPKYYVFNIHKEDKLIEKLEYMHNNPVRAGLVKKPCDWKFSSARCYYEGKSVGIAIRKAI